MANLTIFYLFVTVVLVVVAGFVRAKITSLSLPVSPTVSILTILLPIISFLIAIAHPGLLRKSRASNDQLHQLGPFILQTLQALITTILATLLFEGVVPSSELECKIDSKWMSMFHAHDAAHIRRIQDALDCCGLNSVKDRAYPFPGMSASHCAETFGRTQACRGPWKSSLQTVSGAGLAVVGFVGLMQIAGLYMMRYGSSWWSFAQRGREAQGSEDDASRRPLLTSGIVEDVESAEQDTQSPSHGRGNGVSSRVEPSPINIDNEWSR